LGPPRAEGRVGSRGEHLPGRGVQIAFHAGVGRPDDCVLQMPQLRLQTASANEPRMPDERSGCQAAGRSAKVHENWELRGVRAKPPRWSRWTRTIRSASEARAPSVRPPPVCFRGALEGTRDHSQDATGVEIAGGALCLGRVELGTPKRRRSRAPDLTQRPGEEGCNGHSARPPAIPRWRGSSRRARISLLRTTSPSALASQRSGPDQHFRRP